MNNDQLKSNLLCSTHWIRLVFMALFILFFTNRQLRYVGGGSGAVFVFFSYWKRQ